MRALSLSRHGDCGKACINRKDITERESSYVGVIKLDLCSFISYDGSISKLTHYPASKVGDWV